MTGAHPNKPSTNRLEPPVSARPWVTHVTEDGFQADVVERSQQVPVVIDFWAPWCGPCRALGPLLERLADEAAGAFVLAKVNVDENPDLAARFGVSGIPAVFAVRNARVVDHFTGLLPEDDLRGFMARLVPSPAERLVHDAAAAETSEPVAAEGAYRSALAVDPRSERARLGLARVLLRSDGREEEADGLLRGIESGEEAAEADRLRRVIQIRESPHGDADLATARAAVAGQPDAAAGYFRLGQVLAGRGAYTDALEALIAAAERDKKLAGGPVRELMVAIFQVIGVRSPEADAYRDRLQSLLY